MTFSSKKKNKEKSFILAKIWRLKQQKKKETGREVVITKKYNTTVIMFLF